MKREISMLFRRSKKIMNRAISLLMVITMLKCNFIVSASGASGICSNRTGFDKV